MNKPTPILPLLLIIAFYFQSNISGMMGITRPVIIYILLFLSGIVFLTKSAKRQMSPEVPVLLGVVVLLAYRLYLHQFSGSFQKASNIALPALIVYLVPQTGHEAFRFKQWLQKFLVTFYLVVCCIAILELLTHHYLFGYAESAYGDGKWRFTPTTGEDFRAVSICGSPLNNALITVIINAFILFSSLPNRKRLFCFGFGLFAVFAFNARTSLGLFILTGVLYGMREFRQRGLSQKIGLFLLAAIMLIVVLVAVYLGLGSRLLDTDVESDGSIAVRLRLFEYFSHASLKDYLWGMSMNNVQDEMEDIGVLVIENFWICFMMLFGLIPLVYFTFGYFFLGKKLFDGYVTYAKMVIFFIFIVNASINNSMFSNYSPLLTFLLCIIAFKEGSNVQSKARIMVQKEKCN